MRRRIGLCVEGAGRRIRNGSLSVTHLSLRVEHRYVDKYILR
jgi:hypothetical protein